MTLALGPSVADNLAKLMETARNAVRLDPNDGETQLVLGHAYAYQGMADQALDQFAKAEALAPNNADLLILIAWYPSSTRPAGSRRRTGRESAAAQSQLPILVQSRVSLRVFLRPPIRQIGEVLEAGHRPLRHGLCISGGGKRHDGRHGGGESRRGESRPARSQLECGEICERRRRLSRRCRHAVRRGRKKGRRAACVPADKLSSLPDLIRIKACDQERPHQAAG